mgnify:CR=1 FL=1
MGAAVLEDLLVGIQKNMEKLNVELATMDIPPVAIGIGINTGYAIIGNMGSESRFDYTAIGDTVNLAARLESSTKEVGKDIVIGESTAKACSFPLAVLPSITVKGKQDKINIFTLMP